MLRQIKTFVVVTSNVAAHLLFRRKPFRLKKDRMFSDFYRRQVAQHINVPINFENHYGKSRDYLMEVFGRLKPGSTVLDLGCYLSKRLNWFAKRNPDISFVGVDISLDTLLVANDHVKFQPNVRIVAADFKDLPFPPETFDMAFSHLALCNVSYSQIEAVYQEITRVSKTEIIIIEPYHRPLPLKQKLLLIAAPDKYAHNYADLIDDRITLQDSIPLFDKSSQFHPITIFNYLKK